MMGYDGNNKIILESGETTAVKQKKDTLRLLLFSLGREVYGVNVHSLKEVVAVPKLTAVPHVPHFVVGVFNLRGKIVVLLDIRSFFGLEAGGTMKDARIMVVDYHGLSVGILVDRINDTVDIAQELIEPVLPTIKKELVDYTIGHVAYAGNIIIILDLFKVLKCETIENLRSGGEQ
jgi:purine-binding chemotaxis protein CheW